MDWIAFDLSLRLAICTTAVLIELGLAVARVEPVSGSLHGRSGCCLAAGSAPYGAGLLFAVVFGPGISRRSVG